MKKRTLHEFIEYYKARGQGNEFVIEDGFKTLYVRFNSRFVNEVLYYPVIDLSNIEVEPARQRTGVLTRLIAKLRKDYGLHVYVEIASPELQVLLHRLGFVASVHNPNSFFLSL